ncbi:MAG: hypothetical protein BJ554DRAFT_8231 [Olpidium bornovanus]|uniref:Uncharacterized protein n=1 Tax=Olpidium bornovanus TaxID=278681 RepID=A0A8H7ZV96_9FUNG|nr:MAG: hypothetical protein BJ554DRAFT_8231 [Olpidium bornovanus]
MGLTDLDDNLLQLKLISWLDITHNCTVDAASASRASASHRATEKSPKTGMVIKSEAIIRLQSRQCYVSPRLHSKYSPKRKRLLKVNSFFIDSPPDPPTSSPIPPASPGLFSRTLVLSGNNQIGRIPDEIGELTNLTWIDFTHNQISEVSPRIGELSNLAGLGISDCRLQSFPVGITRLGKLVKLGIFNNLITSLPREIRDLTSLTKLDVSNNLLTTLPREIGCLYNLTWLNLSHNRLTSLPDELGNLVNLRELGLGANRLKRLPNMSRLSEIVMLPIYSNQLVLLEPWIESLVRLEKFDVSCNRLSSIPAEVFSIRGLQYLNIKRNQISRLDMSRLPRDEATGEPVSKLHYLDASENRLAVLPFELSRLRIEEFRMQENPLLVKEPPRLSGGSVFPGRGPRTSTLQTLCVNALLRRSATEIRAEAQRAAGHFDPRRRTSLKRRLGCDYGIYREQLEQSENPPPSGGQLQLPSIYHTGGQIPYPKLAETVRARLPRPCAAALAGLSECHRCHVAYVPHKRRPERGLASPFRPAVEAGERRAEDEDGGEDGASKGDEFEPMEVEAASGGAQAADEDEAYLHVDFLNFNRYHHLPFLRSFCSARCREAHIEQSSWGSLRPSDASFIAVPILTDEPAGQHYFRLTGAAGTAAMAAVRRRFQPQAPTPPPPPLEVPQGLNSRPPPRLQTS